MSRKSDYKDKCGLKVIKKKRTGCPHYIRTGRVCSCNYWEKKMERKRRAASRSDRRRRDRGSRRSSSRKARRRS